MLVRVLGLRGVLSSLCCVVVVLWLQMLAEASRSELREWMDGKGVDCFYNSVVPGESWEWRCAALSFVCSDEQPFRWLEECAMLILSIFVYVVLGLSREWRCAACAVWCPASYLLFVVLGRQGIC